MCHPKVIPITEVHFQFALGPWTFADSDSIPRNPHKICEAPLRAQAKAIFDEQGQSRAPFKCRLFWQFDVPKSIARG
jgi:hypothetical protein